MENTMPTVLRSTVAVIAALLASPALAQERRMNDLTPKHLTEGWLMLFDGETTFGWTVEGEAKVKDGVLILGGEKASKITTTAAFLAPDLYVDLASGDGKGIDGGGIYQPQYKGVGHRFESTSSLKGVLGGPGLNLPPGPVGVESPAGSVIHIRKLAVRPTGLKPLFNGKDLSGWKVFDDPKRSASKWEVTKGGELHLSNGPGDLQTEKKFDNFLLQLECKTNGQALNSGVFFRCIPGQYQNGYEAQVHNGFKDNDRAKPSDFGTGAIYRRIAARKVVANDNEWFTLTVLANGPRIATWVNGYQTVDWTDERKPSDNPRQGLRTAAGHLSIQGHDKTTDILFRNIRLVELKK
jgi:hypothetical protein